MIMEPDEPDTRPINPLEVVLFLQNPWFPPTADPTMVMRYAEDIIFRREILAQTMTGKRLIAIFGEVWYNTMWIDNANPSAVSSSRGVRPADIRHMESVLTTRMPMVVATMGNIAKCGLEQLRKSNRPMARYFNSLTHVHSPHPNAMGVTMDQLRAFAMTVMGCRVLA